MKKLKYGYHVTTMTNWKKIKEEGLVPKIGYLSEKLGESSEKIYFFVSEEEADNALLNWLGEELEEMVDDGIINEDESFVLLKVDLRHLNKKIEKDDNDEDFFEQGIDEKIDPEYIEFLREV